MGRTFRQIAKEEFGQSDPVASATEELERLGRFLAHAEAAIKASDWGLAEAAFQAIEGAAGRAKHAAQAVRVAQALEKLDS